MSTENQNWIDVCSVSDIVPNTGVCALIEDRHVAVFRIGLDQFFAIDNIDPKSRASVLSRGLTGNLGERIVVASPIYKNHFDLQTGECIEEPVHSVRAYVVRISSNNVQVAVS